ncbi:hypothetical protein A8C32_04800 [Flavivirga aquatica]|uniref:SMP-30/Gluconolactonase/LRE-like region domain-containing protein n=1 Tax=Flavivirga aquatica TaxID=1849968 RepID=A0A1E5SHD6_9FLAO|nr:hypothetical protein [Flavivirga aquatica]OEJ98529.1 hypothetical protein A8C32_04800 [Flavivirga aquatica]
MKKLSFSSLSMAIILGFSLIPNLSLSQNKNTPQPATLFVELPDYCPTPDAFDIAPDGSLTLSCPNFADKTISSVIVKISKDKKVSKLIELPGVSADRKARPMGIAYAPDGSLYVCDNQGKQQGRLLRVTFNENGDSNIEIIAHGMAQPNGLRYHNDNLYVTQPKLTKIKSKNLTSGLYCFKATDRNIKVNNNKSDSNLIFTTETKNPKRKVGLDGLVFNKAGELFVGDFGDGEIIKLTLNNAGNKVIKDELYVNIPKTSGMDGINVDSNDNIYIAGFLKNQILKVDTNKKITIIADYPDNDGSNGQIDQPADLIVYNDTLIISNFDLMVAPGMENTKHSKPYTISAIDLKK